MDNQANNSFLNIPSKPDLDKNEITIQAIDQTLNPFSNKLYNENQETIQIQNYTENQCTNQILEQKQLDQTPDVSSQQVDQTNFNIPVKKTSRRKKIVIFLTIIAVVLLITGGILMYHFLSQSSSISPVNKAIKLPKDYEKFKEDIQKGQENNLVEMIYVPKSLKIYEYMMYSNQTIIQGDGQTSQSSSKTVHTFGLLCIGVNETEFQMMLYLMDTKTYENNNLISSITGFPEMLKKENKILRMMEEDSQNKNNQTTNREQNNDLANELQINSDLTLMNEYAPLNQEEIEILAGKGITEQMFNFSHYPIIKFSIFKDGKINMIQQPINLRNDFFQIYLNVLDQISPIVAKDSYKVTSKDGKRVLNKSEGTFKGRSLTNELVDKELTAQELNNGDMSLNSQYQTNKKPSETSSQTTNYDQSSTIQNGSLLESKTKSGLNMSDDNSSNSSSDQNEKPLFKKIEIQSEGLIRFVRQEDPIDDSLYNTIIEYQNEMSVINQNYEQTLVLYNSVFNANDNKGDPYTEKDPEDQGKANTGRILTDSGKDMIPLIQKPIFRKSFASFEFGADIRSECKQFKGGDTKDLCKVGLYSYFNGETIKIAEKQTGINVSKILKYYQLIQNFAQTKLNATRDDILGSLTNIKLDLDEILNKVEEAIDAQRNPILKEVYKVVENDELQIFTLINTFETTLNSAVSTISNVVADPFQAINESTLSFITLKKNSIERYANWISNFYVSQLNLIKIATNSLISINEEDYEGIKSIINNIDDLFSTLIDQPVKNLFDDLENFVLEQSNKLFGMANTIEKSINVSQDDNKADENASNDEDIDTKNKSTIFKRIFSSSNFVKILQKYLQKAIKKISEVKVFSEMISSNLKKNVKQLTTGLLEVIEGLPKQNSKRSDSIRNSLDDFENIFDHTIDLNAGLAKVKEEIEKIFKTITHIQSKEISKIVENIAKSLPGFQFELISKLKSQGKQTIEKFKGTAESMKTNLIQWKDDLVNHSKKLLNDTKTLYENFNKLFSKVDFKEDNPDMYKKPIFNEIDDLAGTVNQIIKFNVGGIVETAKRFIDIPNKFKIFLAQTKELSDKTFNYLSQINLQISGIYFDQKQLWSNFGKKSKDQAQEYNNQLQSIYENDMNQSISQQSLPDLNKQVSTLQSNDLTEFQNSVVDNNKSLSKRVKASLLEIIKLAEYEARVETPKLVIPFKYSLTYPTPIGVLLKLTLKASWDVQLYFEVKVKNAILDLIAGGQTKVVVGGEVSASALVAEVGGYAEGTFLDTSLKLGLTLKVLEKFKGSIYLDLKFQPYQFKMGLYYKTILQIESISCSTRRQLGFFSFLGKVIKAVVNVVAKAVEVVVKVVVKVIKCITSLKIEMKRNNLFAPIEFSSKQYNQRLFQIDL